MLIRSPTITSQDKLIESDVMAVMEKNIKDFVSIKQSRKKCRNRSLIRRSVSTRISILVSDFVTQYCDRLERVLDRI